MKKIMGVISVLIIFVAMSLSGCKTASHETNSKPTAVCICVGAHANSQGLNLNSMQIQTALMDAAESFGESFVVLVDGSPNVIMDETVGSFAVPEQFKNGNISKFKEDARDKAKSILAALFEVKADDPESDVLEAIRVAARTLSGCSSEDYCKTIIVVDTGLSTSGILDFNNNLILAEPELIADELEARNALPDLTGINVLWQQMGDVAYPQEPLTPGQIARIKDIWVTVVKRSGGNLEFSDANAIKNEVREDLPEVTTVNMPDEDPIQFSVSQFEGSFNEPHFLSEEQCRFIGDSDEYMDEQLVLETLTPVASFMSDNPDFTMLLIGTTAGDTDNEYTHDLSSRRAEAVKETLISMGIDENKIVAMGLGSSDPWHIYGVGTEGELASQNRKVVLISADSDIAQELLSHG